MEIFLQKFGPYLLLELLLPGGTLVAIALFLYRRRESFSGWMSIQRLANRLLDEGIETSRR
jgi:hypothetical protein